MFQDQVSVLTIGNEPLVAHRVPGVTETAHSLGRGDDLLLNSKKRSRLTLKFCFGGISTDADRSIALSGSNTALSSIHDSLNLMRVIEVFFVSLVLRSGAPSMPLPSPSSLGRYIIDVALAQV